MGWRTKAAKLKADEICLVADGDNTEKAKDDALKNLNISAYALVLSSANCSGGNTASLGRLSCGANKDPFAKEVCKRKRGRGSGHATASVFFRH